jgi:hypothetical protein
MKARARLGLWLVASASTGCSTPPPVLPPPEAAVARYADALRSGDVDALYGMLDETSRRSLTRERVAALVADQRDELRVLGETLGSAPRPPVVHARLRFTDGEVVGLTRTEGVFRVEAAMGLPAFARTPVEALHHLRVVLARRSYAGLLRVLSPRTRAALEADLRSLVEGLREPEALEVEAAGDQATVRVPGGHRIKLRREEGSWQVDDFD